MTGSTPPDSLGKCSQCDRPALFVGPENLPVCLYCANVLQGIAESQHRIAREEQDRADRHRYEIFGLPIPPHLQPQTRVTSNTVHNYVGPGANVGMINSGSIQRSHVSIQMMPDGALRKHLSDLARAVESETEIDVTSKTEAIEAIGALADESAKPAAARRTVMLRTIADRLGTVVKIGKSTGEIWNMVEPLLKTHFGW